MKHTHAAAAGVEVENGPQLAHLVCLDRKTAIVASHEQCKTKNNTDIGVYIWDVRGELRCEGLVCTQIPILV